MKEFVIDEKQDGKRLDKWLMKECPTLPMGQVMKFLRLKKVRVNGKVAKADAHLAAGDVVNVYLGDECFEKPVKIDPFLQNYKVRLHIVYEDENLIICDKQPGLMCHPDDNEKVNTLLTHIQAHLYQKGEWDSRDSAQFAPCLCNRIDRFTGGLVIAAKNEEAAHILNEKIRNREIEKRYLCIISGRMNPASGTLDSYLYKSESGKKMIVDDEAVLGSQRCLTGYETLATGNGLSLMECALLTGRTHQIRAQFAHVKHPLLGDTQYGDRRLNEKYGRNGQCLYAFRLVFRFTTDAGKLNYLSGKSFSVKNVPFVGDYFPETGGKLP